MLCLWVAIVVKQVHRAPRQPGHLIHGLLHQVGHRLVELVRALQHLEVDVGALAGAALVRVVGVEGAAAVCLNGGLHALHQLLEAGGVQHGHLVDLMAGPVVGQQGCKEQGKACTGLRLGMILAACQPPCQPCCRKELCLKKQGSVCTQTVSKIAAAAAAAKT